MRHWKQLNENVRIEYRVFEISTMQYCYMSTHSDLMTQGDVTEFGHHWFGKRHMQCGAVILRSNFSQIFTKTPHSSPVRARFGASFVGPMIHILPQFV